MSKNSNPILEMRKQSKIESWLVCSMCRRKIVSECRRLLEGNLADGRSSRLGNDNGEDAVLQAGLDSVLVNTTGEGEGALELADRALAGPVAVGGLGGLSRLLISGLGVIGLGLGVVFALSAALDHEGLGIGELDVDVLGQDAGQFTVEVIGIVALAEVKARVEGAHSWLVVTSSAVVIAVLVLVEETEEGVDVARSEDATERHGDEDVVRRLVEVCCDAEA